MPSDAVRVLLVDDENQVLRAYSESLTRRDVSVDTASNGREAIELVKTGAYDAIISDISMPQMTGIDLLKAVRAHDLDVPVILMTGAPDMESAIRAVEYGAYRYLTKPVGATQLWETTLRAARLRKLARLKEDALSLPGAGQLRLAEKAALEVRFNWGMSMLWMAFQPIVDWREKRVYGYEALLRSDEPLMKNPADMLDAAERLNRLQDLGRAVRARVAEAASTLDDPHAWLFVNLHSSDLNDSLLYSAESPLSKIAPRVVLEITERASLEGVRNVTQQIAALKKLGFQVAVDDLGAGYAGLSSFTLLDPEVVKIDMSLVRGVDTDPRRQAIIKSMQGLCDQLGVLVIAEGVETVNERRMLLDLGCNYFQGYLFARPERTFPTPRW